MAPNKLFNFLLFQAGWFCSVLGAANDLPLLGPLFAVPVVLYYLACASDRQSAALLLIAVALLGSAFDQLLVSVGLVEYRGGTGGLLPLWMIGLWVQFATTLNISLRWLRERYVLATLFGLLGGPAAYAAGNKLGATLYIDPNWTLPAAAIGWSAITPLVFVIANRLDGLKKGQDLS
jgi:hypothetical protein